MAKRVATTDLNHDNWDKEDEAEDAGTFKKASESALKGRVIKKAKRRNQPEDRANVFSGLSFVQSNINSADAFSFLNPQKDFKTISGNEKETVENGETKEGSLSGTSETKENVPNTTSPFGGFVFGNSKPKETSTKPFGGFVFSSSQPEEATGDKRSAEEPSMAEDKPDESLSKFLPRAGQWSCEVCMITNPADKEKCAACETAKPNTTVKESSDLMSQFKSAAGHWSCDVCMISNKPDTPKCVACETSKPGGAPGPSEAKSPAEFSFGSQGGFKFQSGTTQPKSQGFIFGSTSESSKPKCSEFSFGETVKDKENGGFTFGATKKDSESKTEDFTFGVTNKNSESKSGGFTFGTSKKEPESKTGGFTFGATTSGSEPKTGGFTFGAKNNDTEPAKGGFTFGTIKVGSSSSTVFGVPQGPFGTPAGKTTSVKSLEGPSERALYLGQLKNLNLQVTSWIKKFVDQNPLVDLSPVFESYKDHLKEIKDQHGVQPSQQSRSGSNGENEESSSETSEDCAEATENQASQVQEKDAFFSTRCKLFYRREGKFEQRGIGVVFLKKTELQKTQIVIRSDNALGTIMLNVLVQPETGVERVGENNVLLACVPNPSIPDLPAGPVSFLIRVKTEEQADELNDHLLSK